LLISPETVWSFSRFSQEPVTLGDHLRRRRLELGLYQKEVAAIEKIVQEAFEGFADHPAGEGKP
jgi:hypothetical protein